MPRNSPSVEAADGNPHVAVIAVLTNLPDSESAFNLARELVSLRLAACANVLPPATSFYRWEGRDEQATEHPVLIKSTAERYAELEAAIRELSAIASAIHGAVFRPIGSAMIFSLGTPTACWASSSAW